ncbi:hypothetical protein ACS0TY_015076 [Phlomoides rotata]
MTETGLFTINCGILMIIFLLSDLGLERTSSISINSASFWVRAHDLPLVCRSKEVIRSIAMRVGGQECFEKPSMSDPCEFIRFKV